MTTLRHLAALLAAALFAASGGGAHAQSQAIVMASTTSLQDSGLLDVLLPKFTAETGISVRIIAQGTGQALATAARGDADDARHRTGRAPVVGRSLAGTATRLVAQRL